MIRHPARSGRHTTAIKAAQRRAGVQVRRDGASACTTARKCSSSTVSPTESAYNRRGWKTENNDGRSQTFSKSVV